VQLLVDLAKQILRLTSVLMIPVVFGAGVLMLYSRRLQRAGRIWLTAAVIAYAALATPAVAGLLSAPLSRGYQPIATAADAAGATVVVMLGGGIMSYGLGDLALDDLNASAPRVLETARVYRLLGNPMVIVSGGNTNGREPPRPEAATYKARLLELGIPADRILVEDQSMTTREEVIQIVPMLRTLGADRFVLITAPAHMWRSMLVFERERLRPIASPAPLIADTTARHGLLPSREGLATSDGVLYEVAALGYYWWRGWL